MKTTLLNQQTNHPIHQKKIQQLINWLAKKLEEKTTPTTWSEVAIILTNDKGITKANREYFGKNRPTDVISFRYDPIPGEETSWSGDLIINVERALQVGSNYKGHDYELALYIAHGFNHLSGADDNTPDKQRKMRATETKWLQNASKEGLLGALINNE